MIADVIAEDTGLPDEQRRAARRLAWSAWPRSRPGSGWPRTAAIPEQEAASIIGMLAWRGLGSFPEVGD